MVAIRFTPSARFAFGAMAHANPAAWVEVDAKLGVVSASGLIGEPLIAVVNSQVDVYLLDPAAPAPPILATHDSQQPGHVLVVDFPAAVGSLTPQIKTALASHAAIEAGIVSYNIHVVP